MNENPLYIISNHKQKYSLLTMSLVSGLSSTVTLAKQGKTKRYHWGNSINGLRSPSPEAEHSNTRSKRRKTNSQKEDIGEVILLTPESVEEQEEAEAVFQSEDVDAREWGTIPEKQRVLLLRAKKQRYAIEEDYAVPQVKTGDEVLIKVLYIGLNPIDWKAPYVSLLSPSFPPPFLLPLTTLVNSDFGFGIPTLPYIAGRDLVGLVLSPPPSPTNPSSRRIRKGDIILTASTDYRDLRKAAYQSYAIAPSFNICRIPTNTTRNSIAGLGVAFIASVLALGVCLGVDFNKVEEGAPGPDLRSILRSVDESKIPKDVRGEALEGIADEETPKKGDWIAIWGGK
jgi:hypothetical protein